MKVLLILAVVALSSLIMSSGGALVKAQEGGKLLRPPPPRISAGAAMTELRIRASQGTGILSPTSPIVAGTPNALAPALLFSIEGINFDEDATNTGFFSIPPDPIGAVGPTHLVSVVNSSIEWHTKAGVQEHSQSLTAFFTSVNALTGTFAPFDPKVIFDQYAGRFLVVTLERVSTGTNADPGNISRILLAVSKTANPNGGWWFHAINAKTTITGVEYWADYPGFAVDEEAVYITANLFSFVTNSFGDNSFGGNRLWIVNKGLATGFYAGLGASQTVHDPATATGGFAGTMQPTHMFGAAPAGVGTFLVMYGGLTFGELGGNEVLQVIRVDNPVTTPVFNQQFVSIGNIEDIGGTLGFPPLPNAPQLGTATAIEVSDRRVLNAVWRNNQLYVAAQIIPISGIDSGQTTAHWWKLNTTALSAITTVDQGNVGGEDIAVGTYTFYPSVAVDSLGNMAVSFSASAPTIYPGAFHTGRLAADPPGTVQTSGVLRAGLDFYVRTFGSGRNRWGDYSGASVDPSNDTTFCVFNEYALLRGTIFGGEDGRWGTAFGCFSFAPPPASTAVTVPALTNVTVGTSGATAAVQVLNVPLGDLGAYQFQVSYNVAVVKATGIQGGAAPFNAVTAVNITNPVSGTGVAKWNHFQGTQTPVSTASHNLASVVFQAVGMAGACSPLSITVVDLVNNQGGFIPNASQGGQVCLVGISALAQTDLRAALDATDPVTGAKATGVKATIDQITSTVTGAALTGVLIHSYEANITYPVTGAAAAVATACRLKPPLNLAPSDCTINPTVGQVHLKATTGVTGSGVVTPIDPLAFVALRLLGSNNPAMGNTTVDLNFVEIKDSLGSLIPQAIPPDTRTFLRGDALADGSISIGDALYIGQHLVNPVTRPAGEGAGMVHPVNAGSVNHDAPNDVISLADAVKIAQFLVGNVNEFYLP